jgi:BTB/POZ domain
MASSDQLPPDCRDLALSCGPIRFEATFRPVGKILDKPLVPAHADESHVAAQHSTRLHIPMAEHSDQNRRPDSVMYQYSEYQPQAGMQWRMCICVRMLLDDSDNPPADYSVALEYGGPTEDSFLTSALASTVKTRVWFAGTYCEDGTSTAKNSMKRMDHNFDSRFPSAWTEPARISQHQPFIDIYRHARVCWRCTAHASEDVSATPYKFAVVLFPDENDQLGSSLVISRERVTNARWPHLLCMLEDPDGSSADVVLRSSDNTTIRTHRCVLSSYEFFKNLLSGSYKEGALGEAELSDLSEEGMRLVVDWTYGARLPDHIRHNTHLLIELWMFASVHGMSDMAANCCSIALAIACKENFSLLFSTAMRLSDKDTARKLSHAVDGSVNQIIDWVDAKGVLART